jgi:uncharacterized DUF497 family protein
MPYVPAETPTTARAGDKAPLLETRPLATRYAGRRGQDQRAGARRRWLEYTILLYGGEIHVGRRESQRNQRIHGISFEAAKEVFDDPNHVAAENYFIARDGEQRYQVIGMTQNLVLLLVVFVDRSEPDAEVIHPISARRAVDYEENIYEDQFR